jgi:hypothetical protein
MIRLDLRSRQFLTVAIQGPFNDGVVDLIKFYCLGVEVAPLGGTHNCFVNGVKK